jgi:CO/xanthine dehydrogenase FAD-binding subunit
MMSDDDSPATAPSAPDAPVPAGGSRRAAADRESTADTADTPAPPPGPVTLTSPAASAEVDALLADAAGGALPLAGGTDLLVQRRVGRPMSALVDLTNLRDAPPPVQQLPDGRFRLSAIAPIAVLAAELGGRLPGIRAAIAVFASPQIRNRATIGGNLGTASPSGDLMPPLVAAGATVRLRGAAGTREIPVTDFLLGPRRIDLRPGEWIEAVDVPDAARIQGFRKIGGRQALTIAVVNLAWQWSLDAAGALRDVRLAVGAAAPTVIRCPGAEAVQDGRIPTRERADRAAAALADDLSPIDDLRGSAQYRRAAAGGLLIEALLPLLEGAPATTDERDEQ